MAEVDRAGSDDGGGREWPFRAGPEPSRQNGKRAVEVPFEAPLRARDKQSKQGKQAGILIGTSREGQDREWRLSMNTSKLSASKHAEE